MLTETACKKATVTGESYRLTDSLGLFLHVTPAGHKSWRMGYWFAKVKKRLVLGSYPAMTLAQAREARDEARKLVAAGTDPAVAKKQRDAARLINARATFKIVAENWLAEQRPRWNGKHAKNVQEALQRDIYPAIGSLPIAEVTKPIVVQLLKKIEARGAIETAKRQRQRIEEIFAHADALGYEVKNPADVRKALRPLTRGRWPALTDLADLRQMLLAVENVPSHPVTKLASRFIALTAVRPGVAQTVTWAELPDDNAAEPIWIIPAERMKLSKERKEQDVYDHHVPLARQAMEVLQTLRVLTGHSTFAFPSSLTMRRPISDSTVSKLYREAGYQGRHVPHGWRSSFSTIMNELANAAERPGDRVVVDLMLAHQQRGVEPIYNRAMYMPRRREIAQLWADMLLDGLPTPSTLLTLPRR
ncbi:tyrosine-type recombinase/integrase [Sphingomonas bisphenolicum]|uniref:Integrase n=1 Tax=Sphingomonas bisphenolicum TaxID=296544 RepID=A0ABN5WD13_9SPHN|nr:integrase arm-type DNA-binding domain-containing protein [Sphingomonas bisphenolicum]BBF70169.1 integrase [Sphingomonas bisphenolicum]